MPQTSMMIWIIVSLLRIRLTRRSVVRQPGWRKRLHTARGVPRSASSLEHGGGAPLQFVGGGLHGGAAEGLRRALVAEQPIDVPRSVQDVHDDDDATDLPVEDHVFADGKDSRPATELFMDGLRRRAGQACGIWPEG